MLGCAAESSCHGEITSPRRVAPCICCERRGLAVGICAGARRSGGRYRDLVGWLGSVPRCFGGCSVFHDAGEAEGWRRRCCVQIRLGVRNNEGAEGPLLRLFFLSSGFARLHAEWKGFNLESIHAYLRASSPHSTVPTVDTATTWHSQNDNSSRGYRSPYALTPSPSLPTPTNTNRSTSSPSPSSPPTPSTALRSSPSPFRTPCPP